MLILPSLLFDNAEPKICSRRGLYDLHAFQFNLLATEMLEKSETFTKEYGYDTNLYLINKPGSYALLSSIRAAYHHDMFVACGYLCLFNDTFDAISDEGKRQPFIVSFSHLLGNMMSECFFTRSLPVNATPRLPT